MSDRPSTDDAHREDLLALLAELRAENGPATADEDAWARTALGLAPCVTMSA